jgi:hypothetical protein
MPWGVANYNTNPALNTSINTIDIAENCSAAGYNNALRQIMADIATWTAAYAVTYPISRAQGGTGVAATDATTKASAFTALADNGGTIGADTIINGKLTRQGYGVHPHFASTSMTGGRIYVQASGADPTANPGDIVLEY